MSGRAATIRVLPGKYALAVGRPDMPTPKGWAWVLLTDVARLESGHTPSRAHPEYWNGPIPWVGIVDARDNHGREITSTVQTITEAGLANSAARMLPAGTVCLVRTAGSIGHVTVLGRAMATSQDLVDWVCGPRLEPWFLAHLFVAEKESLRSFSRGSAHPTVYFPEVKAFHVCLPPREEQRRIVTKLETLQARSRRVREALDAVPPLLEKLRQSILAAAFRGDLTKDWRAKNKDVAPASKLLEHIRDERRKKWEESELAKMKAKGKAPADDKWKSKYKEPAPVDMTGLPELPEAWCWASVEELTFDSTYGTSAKAVVNGDGVPVLGMGNIRDGELVFDRLKTLPAAHNEFPELLLRSGDILFNRTNSIEHVGKSAVFREVAPYAFASYLIRLRSAHIEPEWLVSFINSPFGRAWVSRVASQQVGQANVNGTKLAALAVPVAPDTERAAVLVRIGSALERGRALKGIRAELAQAVARLDHAILACAFRGELVPRDPNDVLAVAMLAHADGANGVAADGAQKLAKKRVRQPGGKSGAIDAT